MNFDDSPELAAFRAKARAWLAQNKLSEDEIQINSFDSVRKWQARKQAAGWGCLSWPKEFGGQAASAIENLVFGQEEEAAGMSLLSLANAITIGMAAATIMECGTDAQKERHLPRIARGEDIWCQLFSEPAAGSDLAGIRTRAQRDGDDWIVNGQKVWTSFAHFADWAILVTRTDPTVAKHKGLTYFLLDMKTPGVDVRPIVQASGEHDFNEVYLDDVRIPDANRVGDVGDGWRVALSTLMNERATIGSIFPTNFEDAWDIAENGHTLNGTPLIEDGATRALLADWYVWHQGLKNYSLRIQSELSQGRSPGPEASVGKLMLGAKRQDFLFKSLDIMNAHGIIESNMAGDDLHFAFLRVIGNRLEGGTDEILRNIIGERVLGLPADHRADKGIAFEDIPTSA